MVLEIRSARPDDLEVLEELERACFSDPWSSRSLTALLLSDTDLVLLVGAPGRADGYAAFRRAVDEAELLRIGVRSGARRRGLARQLLRAGLTRLASRGVSSCFLEVRRTNMAARKLYETQGFRKVGERRRYYSDGSDAILYRCPVDSLNSPNGGASLTETWPDP